MNMKRCRDRTEDEIAVDATLPEEELVVRQLQGWQQNDRGGGWTLTGNLDRDGNALGVGLLSCGCWLDSEGYMHLAIGAAMDGTEKHARRQG